MKRIALVGMPNVGKTALFNKLTGSFQRVANFPGVTVEKKSGWISEQGHKLFEVVDLPGIYSLDATTLDEKVTKDFLLQKEKESSADLFVLVLDATNLDKSLFLCLQLKKLGYPLVIALNLIDEAKKRSLELDIKRLSQELGAVIVPTSAATGEGVPELIQVLKAHSDMPLPKITLPENPQRTFRSPQYVNDIFKETDEVLKSSVISPLKADTFSQALDRWVLHPVWGIAILFTLLIIIFQMLFSWAAPLQDGIESFFGLLGELASGHIGNDLLKSLIVDGIINGVGGVLVFLPQIVLLFFFIQFLEDFGYLGRAAFLMDSFMRRMGLPGKAVIPLLSSHACAIPGIISTRVIENQRERLITMLVIPLTTCSARLPVYAVLIGALVPDVGVLGTSWLRLPGLILFMLYFIGFASAMIVSVVFKKTLPHSSPSMLLMELPPYRLPKAKNLLLVMKNKGEMFLKRAGRIILVVSIILWALMTFPQTDGQTDVNESYAANIGRVFEPVFKPLGWDWRMTSALIPSIAAREVVVSGLAMVISVEEESEGFEENMSKALVEQFSMGSLVALVVWFVFAPQCVATFAVMRRETNGWRWPIFMVAYTLFLAYFFACIAKLVFDALS